MRTVNLVDGVAAIMAAAGSRDFLHIYNPVGNPTLYVCYDGDAGVVADPATLTAGNGYPVPAGGTLQLNNDGSKQIFTKAVYGFVSGSNAIIQLNGD